MSAYVRVIFLMYTKIKHTPKKNVISILVASLLCFLIALCPLFAAPIFGAASDDIYTLLNNNLLGSNNSSSNYVMKRIASYLSGIQSYSGSSLGVERSIYEAISLTTFPNSDVRTPFGLLVNLSEDLGYKSQSSENYSVIQWLDALNDGNQAIVDSINSAVLSFPKDILDWSNIGSFQGLTSSFNGSYLSSGSVLNAGTYYAYYRLSYNFQQPNGYYRFFIPINRSYWKDSYISNIEFVDWWSGNTSVEYKHYDYYLDTSSSRSGIYVYVRDYNVDSSSILTGIKFTTSVATNYSSSYDNVVSFLPFNTEDYQLLKIAFSLDAINSNIDYINSNISSINSNTSSINSNLLFYLPLYNSSFDSIASSNQSINNFMTTTLNSRLTNIHNYLYSIRDDIADLAYMYADEDMIAKKQESQSVINETLDNFTGSGSASAKGSDVGGMKDMSGAIQGGLNAGGSVSGATSVFSNSSDLWSWFSQQNYNDINNISSHNNTRFLRSSPVNIPDVVDFYSINQIDLNIKLDEVSND